MEKIEIDFDVWKELTSRRMDQQDSYSDVLRRVLNIPSKTVDGESKMSKGKSWIIRDVTIPEGTEFRALYKNNYYYGKVENGALVIDGESFNYPSRAARHITGNSVDGWRFWECKLPGKNSFHKMISLRKYLN